MSDDKKPLESSQDSSSLQAGLQTGRGTASEDAPVLTLSPQRDPRGLIREMPFSTQVCPPPPKRLSTRRRRAPFAFNPRQHSLFASSPISPRCTLDYSRPHHSLGERFQRTLNRNGLTMNDVIAPPSAPPTDIAARRTAALRAMQVRVAQSIFQPCAVEARMGTSSDLRFDGNGPGGT